MDFTSYPGLMHEAVTLDGFDLKLLSLLQEDGRMSVQDLADRVGLSASQCSRRRTRLEEAGVITGYRAQLDPDRLGFGVTAFIQVSLARHSPDNARLFRSLVEHTGAIQQAYAVTGDADYILRASLPDLRALSALVNDVLLPHGTVAQVRSMVALERLKDTTTLPVADLRL
jgi:DNA-binding Lrp family transcriptional regulator